ncbi:hypothetical protein [Stenotrophomonas sepilia]
MSKHTPGPWYVGREDENTGEIEVISDGRPYVCLVLPGAIDEVTPANARLIAAAPDLLIKLTGLIGAAEYLQARVVETRGADCMDNLDVAIDEARTAIAKATGEA